MSRVPSDCREDLRELRLADAGLALEQQRPPEFERQEDGRRERAVRDVVALAEVDLDGLDGAGAGGPVVAVGHRANLHARARAGVDRRRRRRAASGGFDPREVRGTRRERIERLELRSDGRQAGRSLGAGLLGGPFERGGTLRVRPVQLADPVREARAHLALDLVEQRGEAAVDLEPDVLDELGDERPRLLAPVGQLAAPLASTSLPPKKSATPEHGRTDDRGPEQRPEHAEHLDPDRAPPASSPKPGDDARPASAHRTPARRATGS